MALQKQIVSSYGVNINYFRIVGLTLNPMIKNVNIKLAGYYNEEARRIESKTLFLKDFWINDSALYDEYFNSELLSQLNVNPLQRGYDYIKANDESFADAIDI